MSLKEILKKELASKSNKDLNVTFEAFESIVDIYSEDDKEQVDTPDIDEAINIVSLYYTGFEDNKDIIVEYLNRLAKELDVAAFESDSSEDKDGIGRKIKGVMVATYKAIINFFKTMFINISAFAKKLSNMHPILERKIDSLKNAIKDGKDVELLIKENADKIDALALNQDIDKFYLANVLAFEKAVKDENIKSPLDVIVDRSKGYIFYNVKVIVETKEGEKEALATKKALAKVYNESDNKIYNATIANYTELNKELVEAISKIPAKDVVAKLINNLDGFGNYIVTLDKLIDAEKDLNKKLLKEDELSKEELERLKVLKDVLNYVKFTMDVVPGIVRDTLKIIKVKG